MAAHADHSPPPGATTGQVLTVTGPGVAQYQDLPTVTSPGVLEDPPIFALVPGDLFPTI